MAWGQRLTLLFQWQTFSQTERSPRTPSWQEIWRQVKHRNRPCLGFLRRLILGCAADSCFGEFADCDIGGSAAMSMIAVCTDKHEKGTSLTVCFFEALLILV